MADKIIMPQLGESIAEGTIVKWLKNIGDAVKKEENVLLISTDKVEAEIPSPSAGVLVEIKVAAGETVLVGTVLGMVGDSISPLTEVQIPPDPPLKRGEESRFLSPLVKKIASENQVSAQTLESLSGSGRDGRLTKSDLLTHLEHKPVVSNLIPAGQRDLVKPVSTMRRVIMENMLASRRTSAHVTTFFEIDYTQID